MPQEIQVDAPANLEPLEIAQVIVGRHMLLKAEHAHSWEHRPFILWRALQDMYEAALAIYQDQLGIMLGRINTVLGVDVLSKASKALLTPKQVREIAKIIRANHTALLLRFGVDDGAVTPEEIEYLVTEGILPTEAMDIVGDAYLYGELSASVRELDERLDVKAMTYPAFKAHIIKRPIALSTEQKQAIAWSKHSTAIHIQGLGNKIADDFSKTAVVVDAAQRNEYRGVIRDAVEENIEHAKTVRQLASEFGNRTGDWSRDFGRIAATEKQQAFQEGFAEQLRNTEGPPEGTYVAKIPKPDACPDCVRLHLTAGQGSRPRVFTLAQLTGNGTNRGVKRASWRAVVGTVHPWCACEIVHVPAGWGFEGKPPSHVRAAKVDGKEAWMLPSGKPWRPRMLPDVLRRGDIFTRDLAKSFLTYDAPEHGVSIRVSDPTLVREIEAVVAQTPKWLFHKNIGVTLITWDHPRPQVPLDPHDLAYWTGNEVRLSHHLAPEKVGDVLRHELGHALNVYLIRKMGSERAVREWHKALFTVAQDEGFISRYAGSAPIECAAEATRLYLYERKRLMLEYPMQFAVLHAAYRDCEKEAGL